MVKSTNRRRFLGVVGASLFAGCSSSREDRENAGPTRTSASTTDATETTSAETETETGGADETRSTDGPTLAKVDLHSHLRKGGGQKIADRYAELGYDALVGTDYNNQVSRNSRVTRPQNRSRTTPTWSSPARFSTGSSCPRSATSTSSSRRTRRSSR